MRRQRLLALVALSTPALLLAPAAQAATFVDDDFECVDDSDHGTPAGNNGWYALLGSSSTYTDSWTSALNGGVSPETDELGDSADFGSDNLDWYENFLLTGHESIDDFVAEVSFTNADDDGMGIVFHYDSADSYYTCFVTDNRYPDCGGGGGDNSRAGLNLARVDTSSSCADDYVVAEDLNSSFSYNSSRTYKMRVTYASGSITCELDANGNAVAIQSIVVQNEGWQLDPDVGLPEAPSYD